MMKKRHILHWAMGVVMTPLLGSCAADDIGDAGRDGCDLILGQPMAVTSVTRATDGRTLFNQFEDNEEVWLWANKVTGSTEYITAWKLTAQCGGSLSSSSTKYWPSDGSKLDVYAIHGNFKTPSSITESTTQWSSLSLTHTVEDDQSSDDKKRLSDLLYSHASSVASGQTVQLTFEHLLAKITVKLNLSGSQGISKTDLANAEVTLTNILPEATFTSSDGKAASAGGSRIPIKAGIISSSINSGDVIGSAIVPLQNFGGGNSTPSDDNVITITLAPSDSRSFSYKPTSNVTLAAGKEYIYTLKIINGELSVSSISVNEFTKVTTQEKKWEIYEDTSGS